MDEETIKKLSTGIAEGVVAGLKPIIKQAFQAAAPTKGEDEDDDKQEMQDAGVTDGDDEDTKKKKIAEYRANQDKPVAEMSARELSSVITRSNMQFFRTTGNRPARISAEPDHTGGGDPFETRVTKHMDAGCKSRGLAINRARRDSPKEYNEWMAKKNPSVQQMNQK